jgi:hypothetical protein
MKRTRDPSLLDWLEDGAPEVSAFTGYDPSGWETSVWILHAMYETNALPGGLTYDEVHRIELAAGTREPLPSDKAVAEGILPDSTVSSSATGRPGWPGPGWKRLPWRELGKRLDVDPFAGDFALGYQTFPYRSWPVNIQPPTEGTLDREQYERLIEHLVSVTAEAGNARCVAFYGASAAQEFDERVIYTGAMKELVDLFETGGLIGSPSNFWPDERSWFVYTDWDLWATKVSGTADLINRLVADTELETVSLSF